MIKKPLTTACMQRIEKANAQIDTFVFCLPTIESQKYNRAYFLPKIGQTNHETNKRYVKN